MTDIFAVIANGKEGARTLAATWVRQGRNRWIDIAINEGWSFNLEEMARSVAFEHFRKDQKFPTLAELDQIRMTPDDHKYFLQHGRKHLDLVLEDIRAARSKLPQPRNRTGERDE